MPPTAEILPLPAADTPPDPRLLAGRSLLVTGAAHGFGAALARAAGRCGAEVILLDRDLKALEAVYDAMEAEGSPQPALYPMDLLGSTPDDHQQLAERLQASCGRLHALVHGAAVLGKPAPLEHYAPQEWLRTLQVNLNGPFLLTRALLPLLRAAPGSRALFISDVCGRQGKAYMGGYGVSKFALEGLMETLAAETGESDGPLAFSLDPGPMNTALRRRAYPAEGAVGHPEPDIVARASLGLLDPAGAPVNGGRYRFGEAR